MTDHDETNDPIDAALGDAGRRLRRQAPDSVASRQALARVTERADTPTTGRRSWWPALIGAGLAAAAIVGVIAIRADDNETPTLTPVTEPTATSTPATTSIEPTTTLVPTTTGPGPTGASLVVDGGCITVTTAAGSATGCPYNVVTFDQLDQRTFVADLDGPVVVTSGGADPLVDLTVTADDEFAARCRWDEIATRIPAGGIVEVVVCNDSGVMLATTGPSAGADWSYTHLILPTPYLPDGADLGFGTPIPGIPDALAFTAAVPGGSATCSILLVPDRSGWKEACGGFDDTEAQRALVTIDEISPADTSIWEVTIDSSGLITSALPVAEMAPSSGCSIETTIELIRLLPASSVVTGIGCIDDKASMTTGSVLTQNGPPDGSIWTALRENDVWAITDNGTGIETTLSFPIAPFDVWSTWPESTVPGFQSYWWEPIIATPTQPTVQALADQVLVAIGTLDTDPEFPLNERIVAVQPGGLPLIIAQVDILGDDSVAGAVIYVWLGEEFDDAGPVGWRPTAILTGYVCARGDTAGREYCI